MKKLETHLKSLIIRIYRKSMKRLRHIARFRNHSVFGPPLRFVANACSDFLEYYENHDYDIQNNGELFVLRSMTSTPVSCLFDVGANQGGWSLAANRLFPEAAIHAFEIAQPTAKRLAQNIRNISNIVVNDFGLGAAAADTKIRYYENADYLTTTVDYQNVHDSQFLPAALQQGDHYAKTNNIEHIDFLKIDVEGMERQVLQGFAEMLSKRAIDVIQFEYGTMSIISRFLLRDYYLFFDKYGYNVGKIYPTFVLFKEYDLLDENFLGPNYLAVSPERMDLVNLLAFPVSS